MAEEHVVIPKERYQRMIDQLAEKKKFEQTKLEDDHKNAEDTTEPDHKEKKRRLNTPDNEKSDHTIPRSREDITEQDDNVHVFEPPGITPERLNELVNVKSKNVKKKKKQDTVAKRRKDVIKKHSRSSVQKIKRNWLKLK